MDEFEGHLIDFTSKIVNKSLPFSQTDNIDICEYCGYKTICNR